jgi:nucleotide-binding universal stress UspA family protein
VVGGYVGARFVGGSGHWEALAFGAGMNARGAMEIIVASIGLSLGILSRDMFSIIVVMALTTSLMAPPALRWTLKRVKPGPEEQERLQREELDAESLIAGVRRVLIPVPCRPEERRAILTLESSLLERMSQRNTLAVTLLTVTRPGDKVDAMAYLDRAAERLPQVEVSKKVVEGRDPVRAILEEAARDYDLLMVGTPERDGNPEELFTSRIDHLLRFAPCPTLVVKGRVSGEHWPPERILLPTNGSFAARQAADLAFVLAGERGEVLLLNVVEEEPASLRMSGERGVQERHLGAAREIVEELRTIAQTQGVRTRSQVEVNMEPDSAVLQLARRADVDLVILGTSLYAATKRAYLGPRVERILEQVDCPIILLNSTQA